MGEAADAGRHGTVLVVEEHVELACEVEYPGHHTADAFRLGEVDLQRDRLRAEDCNRYSRNYAARCINVNSTRNASSSSLRSAALRLWRFCTPY